jgi:glycosyltransferase involved in cell wall biosynthesis
MGQELGMVVEHVYIMAKQGKWQALVKYPVQTLQSLVVLARRRPRVVFLQNPPIFSSLIVYLYSLLTGARFVIDSHTDALLASFWAWSLPLHRFLSRRAIVTLVTNEHLRQMVADWPANAFILADPPATHPHRRRPALDPNLFNIVLVSTASYDEPIREVFKAAAELPQVKFYITGSYPKLYPDRAKAAPANIHFTGYTPDEEFYGLLEAADAVMCLTTENHTIQSGASEALWLGRPIITSNWPILRNYFSKGTLHVDNSAAGLCQAILAMQQDHARFEAEILELQQERRCEWQERARQLLEMIHSGRR